MTLQGARSCPEGRAPGGMLPQAGRVLRDHRTQRNTVQTPTLTLDLPLCTGMVNANPETISEEEKETLS